MNLSKSNYQTHLYFILLIAIPYLISIICVGQIVVDPHDILDGIVVNDHIISRIYKGDFESINYFLSGEIKWYYLEKIFYPTNILHYVLNDKLFFFTHDILKKLFAYFSFYILAKSLGISRFNSALGGVLYSTLVLGIMNMGFAIPFIPYILYLLINKDTLNKKHYFFLFFIGLNISLIHDILAIIFLIPLTLLLKSKNKSLNIYLQVFATIFIASVLTNIHLAIGTALSEPTHREARELILIDSQIILPYYEQLLIIFKNFFIHSKPINGLFVFYIPLSILTILTFILSLFSKQKNIKLISFFIVFILIVKSLFDHSIIDNILIGKLEILKGYNFQRVDRALHVAFALLFIFFISKINHQSFKKFLYFVCFLSIIFVQLKIPTQIIGQYFLKINMPTEKYEESRKNFLEKKYIEFFEIIFNKKSYEGIKESSNNSLNKTFDNYYKFKDYAFIKNIVKDSRIMSVGLDPMIAVMNDIRVIDGYHNIYPLKYKIQFRKIIEKELEKNIRLKNYYDKWGNRIYALYNDENDILLNFYFAKTLGASYVISRFPIKNDELKIVCYECNNSRQMFLYEIL